MLIIGFLILIIGSDLLIRGSTNIAKKIHIPEILIGLTIVAIGTSLPELAITIFSANANSSDLLLGNSIGSNICNLLLILGIIAIIKPIKIDKYTKYIHLPIIFISTIVILGFAMGISEGSKNIITRVEGIILVLLYLIYFSYPIAKEYKNIKKAIQKEKIESIKRRNIVLSIFLILLGIIFLKLGGDLVVNKGIEIARIYGVSESVIGLTIIAVGTALPELITSILAVIKKDEDLALGNLVGSCILNSLVILGIGAAIIPLPFSNSFKYNLLLLGLSIILIIGFCFIGKKNTITKYKGLILLTLFLLYLINLFK